MRPSTKKRHQLVRQTFDTLCKRYSRWSMDALLRETERRTGYAIRTIEGILRGEFDSE